MRRMRRLMIGACVALTACGGDADGFETMPTTAWLETTPGSSSPIDSSPAPSPTTTSSSPSATTSPITSATTVATTVVETTTTLSIEQDVVAGLAEIEANILVCLTAPSECDPTTVAMQDSPAFESFASLIASYVTDGLVARDVGAPPTDRRSGEAEPSRKGRRGRRVLRRWRLARRPGPVARPCRRHRRQRCDRFAPHGMVAGQDP